MKADKARPATVDEYIAGFPRQTRAVLERVRGVIRKALPNSDEVVSYNIPTYKLDGRAVIYFAGWKEHYSLYPSTARLVAAFKDDLAPYEVNDKGTIRFPLDRPVPAGLIGRLARFKAKEVAAAAKPPRPAAASSRPGRSRPSLRRYDRPATGRA